MKNVICIIARTNSTRLPKKVLRKVAGKMMIEHIIDSMKIFNENKNIYICTSIDEEDKALLDIASQNGINGYSGSRESVIDRMLDVAEMEKADNIIRVTGDNIFTDPVLLELAIKEHIEYGADYTRVDSLPLGTTGEVMSVNALKKCASFIDRNQSEYLTVFMFDPSNYRCVIINPPDRFSLPFYSLTVDTYEDWERTLYIYEKIGLNTILLKDICGLDINNIPYFKVDNNKLIKLPNDVRMTFSDYYKMNREKAMKSIEINITEELYDELCK